MGWFLRTSMGLTIEKRGFGLWPMGIQSTDMGFKQSDCRLKHLSQRSTILGDGSKALCWIHIMTLGGMNSIQKTCDEERRKFRWPILPILDGPFFPTSGTINNYKSGMALKFNVYDKDFSLKDPGAWGWWNLDEIQGPHESSEVTALGHGCFFQVREVV